MTTLIEARKSDGTLIGRCDSKCYNAKNPKCTCICGGKNHGIGFEKAFNRRLEVAQEIKEEDNTQSVTVPMFQANLFGGE